MPAAPSGASVPTYATPRTSFACAGQRRRAAEHQLGAQLLQLLLGVPQLGDGLLHPVGDLVAGHPEQLGQPGDQQVLAGQEAERVHADQRLDPAYAGADRRLGEDLHQAELGRPGHVRAAAQLAGVVADLDDPDPLAVLLAEQRHRADPAGLLLAW